MKKMRHLILFILLLGFFTSCERTEEIKLPLPPEKLILNVIPSVEGELNGYLFPVSENPVEILFEKNKEEFLYGYNYNLDIMMVFKKALDVEAGRGYNYYGPSLKIELLDKKGKKIEEFHASMNDSYETLADNLKVGNEKKEWVAFSGRFGADSFGKNPEDEAKKFLNKISKGYFVRIRSEIIEEEYDTESSSSSSNEPSENFSTEGAEIDKGECDKFLDQYEDFVVEYVKIVKKMADDPQNMEYMTEMSQLANKIQGIEGNLENCKADDPELAQRFMEIQQKMLNAMR